MTTFSNTAATKKAKESFNHSYVGNSYSTQWCKEKCKEIIANGGNSFYKKVVERGQTKYYVYSF